MRKLVMTILAALALVAAGALPVFAQEFGSPGGPPPDDTGVLPEEDVAPTATPAPPLENQPPAEQPVEELEPAQDVGAAQPVSDVQEAQRGQLARTGIDTTTVALLAAGLLVFGGVTLMVGRRRSQTLD